MSNEFHISRRKVLAGLGTIGIASAGAGLGTTAFFSDEESLEGSLEAGKIDLKLDYRSTYLPWDRQTPFSTINDTREMSTIPLSDVNDPPDGEDDRIVLDETPSPVYTSDDVGATSSDLAGFPDIEFAQEVTDDFVGRPYTEEDWGTLTDALDCQDSTDTSMLVDGDAGVVVDLVDVKPKDEGEFTISLHHCDNRAYLWMETELLSATENTLVEPEIGANDSDDGNATAEDYSQIGIDGVDGELDDFMWVEAWYDLNCNNIKDETVGPVDITLLFDITRSMLDNDAFSDAKVAANAFIDEVENSGGTNARVGLLTFGNKNQVGNVSSPPADFTNGSYGQEIAPTNNFAMLKNVITNLNTHEDDSAGTGTGTALEAVRLGSASSEISTDFHDFDDERPDVVIVLTDGLPNRDTEDGENNSFLEPESNTDYPGSRDYAVSQADALRAEDARVIAIGIGSSLAGTESAFIENLGGNVDANDYFTGNDPSALTGIFTDEILPELERSEVCIYKGSLGGFLEAGANGVAINPAQTADFDDQYIGAETAEDALCVLPGVNCIAVRWYLPCFYSQEDGMGFSQLTTSSGASFASEIAGRLGIPESDLMDFDAINIVQTDEVSWMLRFAAIQCRHNMENRNPYYTAPNGTVG